MDSCGYTRRDFIKAMGLGVAALAVPGCAGTSGLRAGGRRRPNIVLMMADDM